MRIISIFAILIFAVGCQKEQPLEPVKIVHVSHGDEKGISDTYDYTVVEFPDGERRWNDMIYGEVGDTFAAKKYMTRKWR